MGAIKFLQANLARWCSRLARQPVTLEVVGSSPIRVAIFFASVAQLVEQRTENPRVVGSIPTEGTKPADVAHLVERHLAKVEVASSSLVIRSKKDKYPLRVLVFFQKISRRGENSPFAKAKENVRWTFSVGACVP